jgi:hypothetical protein
VFRRLGAPPEVLAMAEIRHNATYDSDYRECYDEDLAARVYDFYAADFEAFGYDANSWRR